MRDPRKDPRPGDVLRHKYGQELTIDERTPGIVRWSWRYECKRAGHRTSASVWGAPNHWVRDAEVLHTAPDEETTT